MYNHGSPSSRIWVDAVFVSSAAVGGIHYQPNRCQDSKLLACVGTEQSGPSADPESQLKSLEEPLILSSTVGFDVDKAETIGAKTYDDIIVTVSTRL